MACLRGLVNLGDLMRLEFRKSGGRVWSEMDGGRPTLSLRLVLGV